MQTPLLSVLQMDLTMSRCIQGAGAGTRGRAEEQQAQPLLGTSEPRHLPLPTPAGTIFLGNISAQTGSEPLPASSTAQHYGPRPRCLPPYQRQGKPHKSTRERKSHTSCHPSFRDHSVKQRKASSLRCRRLLTGFAPRWHLFVFIYKHLRAALPSQRDSSHLGLTCFVK